MQDIKQEIKKMVELDQKARLENIGDVEKIDKTNRKRVREIIEEHGYITLPKWGKETSHNFWLLIQHFPREETDFMESYVNYMEENKELFIPEDIAYLRDRVNVYKGLPQVYGTQFFKDDKTKQTKVRPIEDISKVDQLRKERGMGTLGEYTKGSATFLDVAIQLPDGYIEGN